jgi:hypothetical protein
MTHKTALVRSQSLLAGVLVAFVAVFASSCGRDQALEYVLQTYEEPLRVIFAQVVAHMPDAARGKLDGVVMKFSRDETPFSFYSLPVAGAPRTVHVSLGGLSALEIVSIALALSVIDFQDSEWWLNYVVYHRALRRQPNSVWIEPADAAGIRISQQSRQAVEYAAAHFHATATFIVAHEVAHVALEHGQAMREDEAPGDYAQRLRAEELAADRFALDIVSAMQIGVFAPTMALVAHLVIFEDQRSDPLGATYPSDLQRIQQVLNYYGERNPEEQANLLIFKQGLARLFAPGPDGATGYAMLDSWAQSLSRESLKVDQE